jgi:endonuclease YncB( thermonuclease family)
MFNQDLSGNSAAGAGGDVATVVFGVEEGMVNVWLVSDMLAAVF